MDRQPGGPGNGLASGVQPLGGMEAVKGDHAVAAPDSPVQGYAMRQRGARVVRDTATRDP
jgi:hypothetical protein